MLPKFFSLPAAEADYHANKIDSIAGDLAADEVVGYSTDQHDMYDMDLSIAETKDVCC